MNDAVMKCAVLGSPIEHSLSPVLHRAAYAELGLRWTYQAIDVEERELRDFIDGLDRSWRGLSLTMPLKRTVMPLLDVVDDWSRLSGVANTVVTPTVDTLPIDPTAEAVILASTEGPGRGFRASGARRSLVPRRRRRPSPSTRRGP